MGCGLSSTAEQPLKTPTKTPTALSLSSDRPKKSNNKSAAKSVSLPPRGGKSKKKKEKTIVQDQQQQQPDLSYQDDELTRRKTFDSFVPLPMPTTDRESWSLFDPLEETKLSSSS
eukprot:PhM_4_TR3316/c0_g1_i2/m.61032